jgi:hypothetical protein
MTPYRNLVFKPLLRLLTIVFAVARIGKVESEDVLESRSLQIRNDGAVSAYEKERECKDSAELTGRVRSDHALIRFETVVMDSSKVAKDGSVTIEMQCWIKDGKPCFPQAGREETEYLTVAKLRTIDESFQTWDDGVSTKKTKERMPILMGKLIGWFKCKNGDIDNPLKCFTKKYDLAGWAPLLGIDIGNDLQRIAPFLAGKTEIPNERVDALVHQMTWNITKKLPLDPVKVDSIYKDLQFLLKIFDEEFNVEYNQRPEIAVEYPKKVADTQKAIGEQLRNSLCNSGKCEKGTCSKESNLNNKCKCPSPRNCCKVLPEDDKDFELTPQKTRKKAEFNSAPQITLSKSAVSLVLLPWLMLHMDP